MTVGKMTEADGITYPQHCGSDAVNICSCVCLLLPLYLICVPVCLPVSLSVCGLADTEHVAAVCSAEWQQLRVCLQLSHVN